MDVRQCYGQLLSALDHKTFLLGGQTLITAKFGDVDQRQQRRHIGQKIEEEIFEELGQIRVALNSVKCRVNSVCARHGTDRWHSFTSFTHPLKGLPAWVSSRVHDSAEQQNEELLSNTSLLLYTQAFCKFVQLVDAHPELLSPFKQFQNGRRSPRSLHLCELPGAFVVALKHLLGPEQSNDLQWFINGLNPHWEWTASTSSSSSPAAHCSAAASLNNDLLLLKDGSECAVAAFGWSGAGDVLPTDEWDDAFLAHRFGILSSSSSLDNDANEEDNKFELVTADGGFDCADNPSCQELLMLPLMKRQVQIALRCLRHGGTLLLKAFTFFERETVALIATLCATFGEVHCTKPPSSKPGNSEVYLLCLDFKGSSPVFDNENGNYQCHYDQIFLKRILNIARTLAGHQIGFIEFNLATFRRLSQDERTIISIEKCSSVEQWGARILAKIRLDHFSQMAPPSSHFSWHQIWHPKNSDKICRLLVQLRNDGTQPFQFAPLVFVPNCAPLFARLLSQQSYCSSNGSTTTTTEHDANKNDDDDEKKQKKKNGICIYNGDGDGAESADFVVFGRIGDVAQRDGSRPVEHSLFAHPNWLKRAEKIHDFCSAGFVNGKINGSTNTKIIADGNWRRFSKFEWLEFLMEKCHSVSSTDLSTFELSLGQSEGILSRFSASVFVILCCIFGHVEQTFCQNGCAKFRFSRPNTAICRPLSRFLANIYTAYKARVASDHRWTLLKFVPLRFFDMPTWTTVAGKDGHADKQQLLSLGGQIAEFNARTIVISSRFDCATSPETNPTLSAAADDDDGTTIDKNGGEETLPKKKAKRKRKLSPAAG